MNDKSNRIENLFKKDPKKFTVDCYNILNEFYLSLGHVPEANMLNILNKVFVEDLVTRYFYFDLEQIKFAINKGIKDNDPPIFVNVPTWNKFIRDFKQSEINRRANNQVEEYSIYKKRVESVSKLLDRREVKKIGSNK